MSCIQAGCNTLLPLSQGRIAESHGHTLDTWMGDSSPQWLHNHMIHRWTAVFPQQWLGKGIHGTKTLPWLQYQLKLHVTEKKCKRLTVPVNKMHNMKKNFQLAARWQVTLFPLNDGTVQFSELFSGSWKNTVNNYSSHLTDMFNKRKYEWH